MKDYNDVKILKQNFVKALLKQEKDYTSYLKRMEKFAKRYGLKNIDIKRANKFFREPIEKQQFVGGFVDNKDNFVILFNNGEVFYSIYHMTGDDPADFWITKRTWQRHFDDKWQEN